MILWQEKGTKLHRQVGRIYGTAMLVVCATSFMIYRVHPSFGVLHFFAIVSSITLLLGMLPMYIKGYKNRLVAHLSWMYWSVIGLYCAFVAEILTRLPDLLGIKSGYGIFYMLIGVSAGIVSGTAGYFFRKRKVYWTTQFGN